MIEEVARLLRRSKRVLFITGAGISADSGLPTYRGVGGIYNGELTREGYTIEEALSGEVMRMQPEVTWKYLSQIESRCRGAQPNPAHTIIAELERAGHYVMVFTQNVDGLHRDAGSGDVVEIHGNLRRLACTRCPYQTEVADYSALDIPPSCPECGGRMRPRVVLFGEMLPMDALRRLQDALTRGFDMVFSIGTSSRFPYVVEPLLWSRAAGIPTVEINPSPTELSRYVDYWIKAGAAQAMQDIWRAFEDMPA